MGWSWLAVTFVVISTCAASKDGEQQSEVDITQREVDFGDFFEHIEQREVTPDPDFLKKLLAKGQLILPDTDQVDVTMDLEADLNPMGGPPMFGPRSIEPPPSLKYPVKFPLSRPTLVNIQAICLHGNQRPRYSDNYFPRSGFGSLKRRATAVNRAESWFGVCCKGNGTEEQEQILCCLKQAWEASVKSFCKEDTSVKDRVYHCCKKDGHARLSCFDADSPNPNYEATEEIPLPPPSPEPGFTFNPDTCQRSDMSPRSARGKKQKKPLPSSRQDVDISFPPGRPTAGEVESLCRYRKLRPRYDLKCLPHKGYGWLARQSKTVNRVEKAFKTCCKKKGNVFNCLDIQWRAEMDRYCRDEVQGKMNFPCCEKAAGKERYACFHARAPHQTYGLDQLTIPAGAAQNVSLDQLCETHKLIKKKFPVGFPIQGFVSQCCSLSSEQKTTCILEKFAAVSKNLCSRKKSSSPSANQCCHNSQDSSQCLSNQLLDAITKATSLPRLKKRKCPLS